MRIWVDADACPGAVKEILFRAAQRVGVELILVANQPLRTPPSKLIKAVQVAPGFDVADNHIVKHVAAGDLVVTADIPLAAEVIDQGGDALNPRGERYTRENIRQRLTMRDFMDQMRASGVMTGGPPPLGPRDRKAFADELDRLLAKAMN
ncbi:YaiI/YqxD family protein [Endothiovibrio diazotrophicus]